MSEQVRCPECSEEFSRPGLHGHLRFAHNMSTEEANRAFEEATGQEVKGRPDRSSGREKKEDETEGEVAPEGAEAPTADSLREAVDREEREPEDRSIEKQARRRFYEELERYRRAKARHRAAEEIASGSGLWGQDKAEREICAECEEEMRDAKEEANKALKHLQVARRE